MSVTSIVFNQQLLAPTLHKIAHTVLPVIVDQVASRVFFRRPSHFPLHPLTQVLALISGLVTLALLTPKSSRKVALLVYLFYKVFQAYKTHKRFSKFQRLPPVKNDLPGRYPMASILVVDLKPRAVYSGENSLRSGDQGYIKTIAATRLKSPTKALENTTQPTEVIIAVGPGGSAWDKKLIGQIEASLQRDKTVSSFTILGDGEHDLSTANIIDAIKIAKEKQLTISLFIQAHGELTDGEHYLCFSNKNTSSRALFQQIKRELGDKYPLFVFTTACYGGAAGCIAANELPKGTTFVALSKPDSIVQGFDIKRFVVKMMSNPCWHNSEKMLYSYLTVLQNRFVPIITYAPNPPLNLERALQVKIGKSLSDQQKTEICQRLSHLIPISETRAIIEKIEKSSTIGQFVAVEWGKTLAVSLEIEWLMIEEA